jgi:disulfide bond formation protein DsbB
MKQTKTNIYQRNLTIIIFIQALIAMLGSLYYSNFGDIVQNISKGMLFPEDMGFYPCQLCWWARILMYPVVWISAISLLFQDKNFSRYTLAISIVGIPLELYHYILQKFPIENPFDCSMANPCGALNVNYFGFLTIPLLCLIAFTVIGVFSFLHIRSVKNK